MHQDLSRRLLGYDHYQLCQQSYLGQKAMHSAAFERTGCWCYVTRA